MTDEEKEKAEKLAAAKKRVGASIPFDRRTPSLTCWRLSSSN